MEPDHNRHNSAADENHIDPFWPNLSADDEPVLLYARFSQEMTGCKSALFPGGIFQRLFAFFICGVTVILAGCSPAEKSAEEARPDAQAGSPVSVRAANTAFTSGTFSLARVCPTNSAEGKTSLSACCHILLFYGLGPADLQNFHSGQEALRALTDEEEAMQVFGKSPFVRTRAGLRYELEGESVKVGESHRDQCLATFAALNLPLETPVTLRTARYSIASFLNESVANFTLEQKELGWTTMAYARYLPPAREWKNRFGEMTSFSDIVRELLRRDLNRESCAGTHSLQALVQIDNADSKHAILDEAARKELDLFITRSLKEAVRCQHESGEWSRQWASSLNDVSSLTPFKERFLVTGHLLEVFQSLRTSRRPSEQVYQKACAWLRNSLNHPEIQADGTWICPFTHAVRSLRDSSFP